MDELLRAKCDLLAENREIIRKGFFWSHDLMHMAASVIFTGADRRADVERMKECRKILKAHQGFFSDFRGHIELSVISRMALSDNPERYVEQIAEVYQGLKKGKLFGSEYMALGAMSICERDMAEHTDMIVERTRDLIQGMKQAHPFLTGHEDMAYAALMALSDRSVDSLLTEVEECYEMLKPKFVLHSDAVQSLSQITTLCEGDPKVKCERITALYDALKERGARFGKEYELAALGVFGGFSRDPGAMAETIIEVSDYLKTKKGFGNLIMGKMRRLMFSTLLVAEYYAPESTTGQAAVLGSTLASVIAEEILLMMIVITSTQTSHAASNSSGS